MKNAYIYLTFIVLLVIASCEKDEVITVYSGGTESTLTSNVSTVEMAPVDSSRIVFIVSWTDPSYTVEGDATTHNVNYTLDFDIASNSFASSEKYTVTNGLELSFTGKELNKLMNNLGLEDTTQVYSLEAKLTSSLYVSSTQLESNVISFSVRPYSVKPTALYPVPDNLFIVGDATGGGWDNPVPLPTQQFTRLDEFTFGGAFELSGGAHYLFLPVNGDWGHKYAFGAGSSDGGDFAVDDGPDITAPANSGLYKITVDFVKGRFTVTEITSPPDIPPTELYIVGDATPGGWDNPVPVPGQQFNRTSNAGFEITIDLTAGAYLFLPVNGSWDHKFAIADASLPDVNEEGTMVVDSGQDIPSPGSGTYTIFTEFINKSYTVTKQ